MAITKKKNNEYMTSDETRLALLEQSIDFIKETLFRIELNQKEEFTILKNELTSFKSDVDEKLDSFNSRLWTNFYWILGTMGAFTGLLIGVMAKGFGWFH